MKKAILFFILSICSLFVWSQDVLIKTDKSQMDVTIMEINPEFIVYKRYHVEDSPIQRIPKSEVWKIFYENGTEEVFSNQEPEPSAPPFDAPDTKETPELQEKPVDQPTVVGPKSPTSEFRRGVFFGLTAGVNLATGIYDYKSGPNPPFPSARLTPTAGFNIDFRIAKWISLQTNFLYKGKGDKIDMGEWVALIDLPPNSAYLSAEGTLTRSINYAEASLVPTFSFGFPYRFQLGFGPYFEYGLHGKEKSDYKLIYSYDLETEEEPIKMDRKVEFVDLFLENDDESVYYVNSWNYGWLAYMGLQEGHSTFGLTVSWSSKEWEPDYPDFFGTTFKSYKTRSLVATFFYTYWFGK